MTAVVNLHPHRWVPDFNLVDAALAGRIHIADLDAADRAWLVAALTHRGTTTDLIADHLHCSRRLVQGIRCEPMAVLARQLFELQEQVAAVLAKAKAATSAPAVTQLVHEIDHLKEVKGTLIQQLADMRQHCQDLCPPPVIVMHPPRRRHVNRHPDQTIPLFEIEES